MMLMMSGYTLGFFFPKQAESLREAAKLLKKSKPEAAAPIIAQDDRDAARSRDEIPASYYFFRYF